ncbi:MAG TPA: hypothetical protein VK480_04870 [Solirubrobacterales bacterium]|nr:hypothetical protein [Solirubrobacterales bacterium]
MASISTLEAVGIVCGIGASLAAIVGLGLTLLDRRRKKGDTESVVQNIYLTPGTQQPSVAASAVQSASSSSAPGTADDVRYVLLLEACLWLASDLHLAWTTFEEKRRSIELIERFTPELEHDVDRFSAELDAASPGTSDLLRSFLSGVFKAYLEVMRINTSWLEYRNDGEREPEEMEAERESLHSSFVVEREKIGEHLRASRAYLSALAEQRKNGPWKALGFNSPEDYSEYMQPTMRSLTSSPGDLAEDVLERLLDGPIALADLEKENLPSSIRVELMNRLLADKWAEVTSDHAIALTEAGARLLKKRLAAWHGTAPPA